jgi:DNA-binding MarR family transcriptional regulator
MSERLVRGAIVSELMVSGRHALELSNRELRADGIDPAEYGPLSFIGVMQPVTRTHLTQATGLPRTTQRDVIKRLLDAGHVREVPNPRDGRSTLLELTPAGQAIFDKGKPAFQRALAKIDEALDGRLDEHEEVVWQVRTALQSLVDEWSA